MSVSLISIGCAVCFGADPNSLSSKALITSVFVLGGVVVAVLAGIAWTAFVWAKRAKALE
jgi:predicted transporter